MDEKHIKHYAGTPFSIEVSKVENGPGRWASTKISIYNNHSLIGEYLRNYPSFATDTFYPFKINDVWYALYSAHYSETRVMKLYEDKIEDWCGFTPGFCPTEYYVPRLKYVDDNMYFADCDFETEQKFIDESKSLGNVVKDTYATFGFLSGCVWGDDTSWKLQYIDLSKIEDKIITITEKFGYWVLPGNLKLTDCIDMTSWEPDIPYITLLKSEFINLNK